MLLLSGINLVNARIFFASVLAADFSRLANFLQTPHHPLAPDIDRERLLRQEGRVLSTESNGFSDALR
jgi:hypothetical protein